MLLVVISSVRTSPPEPKAFTENKSLAFEVFGIAIDANVCFAAEVGLSGEIRPVNRVDQRILQAEKLGFERIYVSKYNRKGLDLKSFDIEVVFVSKVDEVFGLLFG